MVHRKINPWYKMSIEKCYFNYVVEVLFNFVVEMLFNLVVEVLFHLCDFKVNSTLLLKRYSTFVELLLQCADEVLFQHVC